MFSKDNDILFKQIIGLLAGYEIFITKKKSKCKFSSPVSVYELIKYSGKQLDSAGNSEIEKHLENCSYCFDNFIYLKQALFSIQKDSSIKSYIKKLLEKISILNISLKDKFKIEPYHGWAISPISKTVLRSEYPEMKNGYTVKKSLDNGEARLKIFNEDGLVYLLLQFSGYNVKTEMYFRDNLMFSKIIRKNREEKIDKIEQGKYLLIFNYDSTRELIEMNIG